VKLARLFLGILSFVAILEPNSRLSAERWDRHSSSVRFPTASCLSAGTARGQRPLHQVRSGRGDPQGSGPFLPDASGYKDTSQSPIYWWHL